MIFSGSATGTVAAEARLMADYVIPLLEDADRIKFAAERLVPADDHHPGEWLLLKPPLALCGLWTLRRLDDDERTGSITATPRTPASR